MQVLQSGVSRREAIRLLGLTGLAALVAACSPASPAPSAPPAQPTAAPKPTPAAPAAAPTTAAAPANAQQPAGAIAQADWDKLVAAAKQEGTLSIATYAGTSYRRFLDVFESAYGIKA